MRTTIRLDDDLLRRAKQRALDSGRTLNAVIEDALRASLDAREVDLPVSKAHLPTFRGSGLQPGVDLDDMASVYDIMDGIG
jgi:plasmid stability protein